MKIYEVLNDKQKFSFPCIYLWTNLVNNKVYIGQTQNLYQRMQQYYSEREKRCINLALSKYGFDNFDIDILEKDINVADLDKYEQYWMDYYESYDLKKGYNVCKEAGTTRGYHHTDEDKHKMSEIVKKRLQEHPEYIKCGSDNPMFGKKVSVETRAKISEGLKGNQNAKGKTWKMPEGFGERQRQFMLGKQYCLGRKLSPETRAKIAESNRRRVISDESKKKMSESHKGKTTKKVKCVELDIIFDSIGEAAEFVGVDRSGIGACLRGAQKTSAGFHWERIFE